MLGFSQQFFFATSFSWWTACNLFPSRLQPGFSCLKEKPG